MLIYATLKAFPTLRVGEMEDLGIKNSCYLEVTLVDLELDGERIVVNASRCSQALLEKLI